MSFKLYCIEYKRWHEVDEACNPTVAVMETEIKRLREELDDAVDTMRCAKSCGSINMAASAFLANGITKGTNALKETL